MEKLGPYELLDVLGEGGMGRVYRARDTRYNRVVALKVMSESAAAKPEFEKMFRREADLVTRMNSPHIVPIHGYGEVNGAPFLDMRFVDGYSLSSVVKKFGPASLTSALTILEQAASALDDAHNVSVVHRDVKPANLLIDRKGFVYLADFGIAVAAQHRCADQGRIVGSWPYMAPERFTGGEVSSATDTYALACVLHYAIAGRPPFLGSGVDELREQHLYSPPPSLVGVAPEVTPEIDEAINWALAKDPSERPASSSEWVKHVKAVARSSAAGAPVIPSTPEVSPAPPRPLLGGDSKTKWLFALLVLLVMVGAALLAVILNN